MAVVTMKELLEAGVHFGHQTRRWNPKIKPFIFTERNDIYIIDLQKTLVMIGAAYGAIRDVVAGGGNIIFVGTKKQAMEPLKEHAVRCGMPYVNNRWLGGTLTNFTTIHSRVMHLDELERRDREGELDVMPKKEALQVRRQIAKLERNLEGIRTLHRLPDMVFVIDPRKDRITVSEARKLEIPIVGLVDTNCDPDEVDYVIPANDDAIRAVSLLCRVVADAVIEGAALNETRMAEQITEKAEARAERASGLLSDAVPAYSASPDDISGPDFSTVNHASQKGAESAGEEASEQQEPVEPAALAREEGQPD